MKYNLKINNDGALPIPYCTLVGDNLIGVDALYKDRPILCNAMCINGTARGQIQIHCTEMDFVFKPDGNLVINLEFGESK